MIVPMRTRYRWPLLPQALDEGAGGRGDPDNRSVFGACAILI